jgi:hypothetical protein
LSIPQGKENLFNFDIYRIQQADNRRERKFGPRQFVVVDVNIVIVGPSKIGKTQIAVCKTCVFEVHVFEIRLHQKAFLKK